MHEIVVGKDKGRGFDCALSADDILRHCYVVGRSGAGKTTLLEHMVLSLVYGGHGVCCLDPHGDMFLRVLERVPRGRSNDVVVLDPSDDAYPFGFNVLDGVGVLERPRVAQGVVAAFQHIWASSWGPRLHDLLYNAVYALLEDGQASLIAIPRLLHDERYRAKVVERITQAEVRAYWLDEYARYPERFRVEITASTLNKVRRLFVHPAIKNIVGQRRNRVDIRHCMDTHKIVLVNLSKGLLGSEATNVLGALLVSEIHHRALSRADIPEEQRVPFFVVIDEFQTIGSDIFMETLSEARKYALGLMIAHQYTKQISTPLLDAIIGNAGSLMAFLVGATDAQALHQELDCSERYLVELAPYTLRTRLLGQNARTLERDSDEFPYVGNEGNIRKYSREKYAVSRAVIEAKLARFHRGLYRR